MQSYVSALATVKEKVFLFFLSCYKYQDLCLDLTNALWAVLAVTKAFHPKTCNLLIRKAYITQNLILMIKNVLTSIFPRILNR